jgi:hypothetical protein
MRWGRGFFRLWIAVTIIWTTMVMASVGTEPFEIWKPMKWEVTNHETGVTVMVDSSQSLELIKAQMSDAAQRVAALLEQQGDHAGAKKAFESASTRGDELIKTVIDWKAKRADRLRGALSWLLGPPVGLLALGLMTVWVAKGFRNT